MEDVKHDLESAIATGTSGSKVIAKLSSLLSQVGRKGGCFTVETFNDTSVVTCRGNSLCDDLLGQIFVIMNQLRMDAGREATSFLNDIPESQRTITWIEADAPAYARDSRLFHEMESKLMEKERLLRAFGESQSITTFDFAMKFGDFYLSAGSLGLADAVFNAAEKLANTLKLADDPETCKEVADLELHRAKCAFGRSNYENCITDASKSISLLQIYDNPKNYNFLASGAIPAWDLIGRSAIAKNDSQLAKKAFLSVYELGKKYDYFKLMPESNAYYFGRAGDYFTNSGDVTTAETLLN